MTEPWVPANDIAAHLGATKNTAHAWIAEKHVPALKVSRLWKFQTSEIKKWVRSGRARTADEE
ncbi:DNA-binding protein [Clavibacter michiganensis subsp. michiganensis]|uniref:helix-turn-helix domain-containing protein n=1 Tax=Clavibacter michiganensis TaxID=28447 RepID=UPI0013666A32|nr:DNA-binding protein [Clavibacter michiganensis subsp. michiganensis]